ncbi:MAG: L,D-transpeptidase [Bacteroidota bacterium]|nr:L,D-transpeptidase [Bacteroidota bacterium]
MWAILYIAFVLAGCTKRPASSPFREPVDSLRLHQAERNAQLVARHRALAERFPKISYRTVVIRSKRQLDSLFHAFGVGRSRDSAKVLATLNRKEFRFFRIGDSVVVPDQIVTDLRAYSVFPQFYAQAATIPQLIVLSNKYQAYACYEHGELVRFAACNTGRKGKPTLPGKYFCNWKQRKRVSSLNSEWVLPFTINFHQYAGCAFHAFEMPGRPVSHACVRQFLDDAEWLYRWVRTGNVRDSLGRFLPYGTPVIILDMFDYRRKRYGPWLDLTSNQPAIEDLPPDPFAVEEPWIPISQIPHKIRRGLPNKRRYLVARDTLLARGIIDSAFRFQESIDYNERRRQRLKMSGSLPAR